MKLRKNISVLLLLFVAIISPLQAQIKGAGSGVFHFLDLPVSSRINALGGDNVAIADGDISMAFMNPALLTSTTDKVLQLNYAYYLAGTMFGSVMYGHNYKHNYFAAAVHYLDYGNMPYADENGNLLGTTFSAKDICVDLIYARQLGPMFRVGATLKPIFSIYESYSSFALGADVGAHFQTADSTFHMGLALRNIGWQLKAFYEEDFGQHTEMLPLNLELGLSYRLAHAPIRFSLTMHNLQRWNIAPMEERVRWGDMLLRHTIWAVDVVPKSERFYLTLSYNHRRQAEMKLTGARSLAGLAFGAGVKIYKFRLGFALSQYTKSNFTYQVSLSTDINSFLK
ncbi:MAG: type IX secretion system protein PorQ [Paludibacteraceae bacterium]|nr:type IX secretion system protein PorQ [Paludibacteraceae bacterium]